MKSRLFPGPPALTGPPQPAVPPPSDPAHWHPGYHEPICRELYDEMREQLLAGLADGTTGEVVSC